MKRKLPIKLFRESDHSSPSSAEVKNDWRYTSTPHRSSWRGIWLRTGYFFLAWNFSYAQGQLYLYLTFL
jgi:hypothetical protein